MSTTMNETLEMERDALLVKSQKAFAVAVALQWELDATARERDAARQSRARLIPLIHHYQEYEKASLKVIRGLRVLFKAANRAKRRMRWQRNAWKNIADVIRRGSHEPRASRRL